VLGPLRPLLVSAAINSQIKNATSVGLVEHLTTFDPGHVTFPHPA